MKLPRNIKNREEWKNFCKKLEEKTGRKVIVESHPGLYEGHQEDGTIYINNLSTPKPYVAFELGEIKIGRKLYNIETTILEFENSDDEELYETIKYKEKPLAYIKDRRDIYLLFDGLSCENPEEQLLLLEIFKLLLEANLKPYTKEEIREKNKLNLKAWMTKDLKEKKEKIKGNIDLYQRNIDQAMEKITQQTKKMKSSIRTLKMFDSGLDNSKIEKTINKLFGIGGIDSITISSDMIIATTSSITMKDVDGKYMPEDIGRYKIEINPTGNVMAFSLDGKHPSNIPQHPHVSYEGRICYGEISATVAELMADMEIDVVVTMTMKLLECYNKRSPFGNGSIEYWLKRKFGREAVVNPKWEGGE